MHRRHSASYTVNVDKTAPTAPVVAFSGPTSYGLLDNVYITCSATDSLSGVESSTCASTTGAAWSFGPGVHTREAAATDKAGNEASASTSLSVTATPTSLCGLVSVFTDHKGTRTSPHPVASR